MQSDHMSPSSSNVLGVKTIWAETPADTVISSSPMCLDSHKYLITRYCDPNGVWIPAQMSCATVRVPYFVHDECPRRAPIRLPGQGVLFCYGISEYTKWNENDYAIHQTIFDLPEQQQKLFFNSLEDVFVSVVYSIPARLIDNEVRWMTMSRMHDPIVTEFEITNADAENNGCVAMQIAKNQPIKYIVQSCEIPTSAISIYYEETSSLRMRLCPNGWYASHLTEDSTCYRIHKINRQVLQPTDNLRSICGSEGSPFVIYSLHHTQVFIELMKLLDDEDDEIVHQCPFTVDSSNDSPITEAMWELFSVNIAYINWHLLWRELSTAGGMLVLDGKTGKWLFSDWYSVIICQTVPEPPSLSVTLEFLPQSNSLLFEVKPVESAWGHGFINPDIGCTVNSNEPIPITIYQTECSEYFTDYQSCKFYIHLTPDRPNGDEFTCKVYEPRRRTFVANENPVHTYYSFLDVFAVTFKTNAIECDSINKEQFLESVMEKSGMYSEILTVSEIAPQLFPDHQDICVLHLTASLQPSYISQEENLLKMTDPVMLRLYNLHIILSEILAVAFPIDSSFAFISAKSTEMCLPKSISKLNSHNWWALSIGETAESIEGCDCSSGLMPMRTCVGDHLEGGTLRPSADRECECQDPVLTSTDKLERILSNYTSDSQTSWVLLRVLEVITSNYTHPMPTDLFIISEIMVLVNDMQPILRFQDASLTLDIYDVIMSIDNNIIRQSSKQNSTNRLLHSLDIIVNALIFESFEISRTMSEGISLIKRERLVVAIIDPRISNITGIGVFDNHNTLNDNFSLYEIRTLTKFQSPIELLTDDHLEIACYLTPRIFNNLQKQIEWIPIVVVVFKHGNMFQYESQENIADRMVISFSMPTINNIDVPLSIYTFFRSSVMDYHSRDMCHFWNYTLGWSMLGMRLSAIYRQNIQCHSTHLTHFGHLLLPSRKASARHERILDIITLLGCSLSLLGIIIILCTAIKFPLWRAKPSSKFLMQFALAIGLQLILFSVNQFEIIPNTGATWCILIGFLNHYAVLLVFGWQLIIAYLQLLRYVVVLHSAGSDRWIRNVSLINWCLPILPPVVLLSVDPMLYVPNDRQDTNIMCYPHDNGLYFGLLLPLAMVILVNVIVFAVVLWEVRCKPNEIAVERKVSHRKVILIRLRLFIFLFFLLGLTWIFGMLAILPGVGLFFDYLFCLTATTQGLMLFVYFIGMDPMVRTMWIRYFRYEFCGRYRQKYI